MVDLRSQFGFAAPGARLSVNPEIALRRLLRRGAWQARMDAARGAAEVMIAPAVFAGAVALLAAMVEPGIGRGSRLAFLLAGLLPWVAAVLAALRPVSRRQAAMLCDRLAGWPDLAVAAVEVEGPWREAICARAASQGALANFPLGWKGWGKTALKAGAVFWLMASAAFWLRLPGPARETIPAAEPLPATSLAAAKRALQDVWERPELEPLRQAIEQSPPPPKEELLLAISRAEEALRAAERGPGAKAAAAVSAVSSMAADALEAGDLAGAAAALEELAGAGAQSWDPRALADLAQAASQLAGSPGARVGKADAAQGADASSLLRQIAEALRDEARRRAELPSAQQAFVQLAAVRSILVEEEPASAAQGTDEDGRGGGAGAGEEGAWSDTQPFARIEPGTGLKLGGAAGDGASMRFAAGFAPPAGGSFNLPSEDGPRAPHASELSKEPVATESLPVRYREAIRRYFESLRQP